MSVGSSWASPCLSRRGRPTYPERRSGASPRAAWRGVGHWNLFYRLTPPAGGHGYATELGHAAIEAAHRADPDQPVVAWILDHNFESRRVAERLGLVDQGIHYDRSDGVLRHAYADRPFDLAHLT